MHAGAAALRRRVLDRMNGIGAHEVIIETPDHTASLATLLTKRIEDVRDLPRPHPRRRRLAGLSHLDRDRIMVKPPERRWNTRTRELIAPLYSSH